jgi:hypothetical protein
VPIVRVGTRLAVVRMSVKLSYGITGQLHCPATPLAVYSSRIGLSQAMGVCLRLEMQHYLTGRTAKTKAA